MISNFFFINFLAHDTLFLIVVESYHNFLIINTNQVLEQHINYTLDTLIIEEVNFLLINQYY